MVLDISASVNSIGVGLSELELRTNNYDEHMDYYSDDAAEYDNVLVQAVCEGDFDALKTALGHENKIEDINAALCEACNMGDTKFVEALLKTGNADLCACDVIGHQPIGIAAYGANLDVLDYIFDIYLEKDDQLVSDYVNSWSPGGLKRLPLHLAVMGDDPLRTVPYLLEKGASPILTDQNKMLPIHYGKDSNIRILLYKAMEKQWTENEQLAEKQGTAEDKPSTRRSTNNDI